MKTIPFVKMQGVGNDFVVVDEAACGGIDFAELAVRTCARQFGIGADGLLIVGRSESPKAAFSFQMRNPDGTADMCGNGLRCAILYAYRTGIVKERVRPLWIETPIGLLEAVIDSVAGSSANIRSEIAVPGLEPSQIPFTGLQAGTVLQYPLEVAGIHLPITAVNTGSTHSVAFVDELPSDEQFFSISPLVEYHSSFPERTSLIWAVRSSSARYSVRIWERGAGETLGCGTGACAVAVAAILNGMSTYGTRIEVSSKGGTLWPEWIDIDSPVWLAGPAEWVFSGEFSYERIEPDMTLALLVAPEETVYFNYEKPSA